MPPIMSTALKNEISEGAALMELKHARTKALKTMFAGTQLSAKSNAALAKDTLLELRKVKKEVAKIPGIEIPDLNRPSLNVNLFKNLDLRKLVALPYVRIPELSLPDIKLMNFPGLNLDIFIGNLRCIIKHTHLLPKINIAVLVKALIDKFPHFSVPSILFDLAKLMDISYGKLIAIFPNFTIKFPDFPVLPDLKVKLPNLAIPDVNLPSGFIYIDLPEIDIKTLKIPGLNMDILIKIPGVDKAFKLLLQLIDMVDIPDLLAEMGAGFISDFLSSILPIVQQLKSGAVAAKEWGETAQALYNKRQVTLHSKHVAPGDPKSACKALEALFEGDAWEHAGLATIATTQFASSSASLFGDGGIVSGPIVSAAAAAAKMCQKITIWGMRRKEMKRVNIILAQDYDGSALDAGIFSISPLLGCYYIANSDTSVILDIITKDFLREDWISNADRHIREDIQPLITKAQGFIVKSRYILGPLDTNKGMFEKKGLKQKIEEKTALYFKKKLGIATPSKKYNPYQRIT